jgi:hypothetical protein
MKNVLIIAIISTLLLVLAGCSAPTCYPPNKIMDNKCCLDQDNNDVCDFEEPAQPKETVKETPVETAPETPTETPKEVPAETTVVTPVTKPTVPAAPLTLGKQKMNSLDPHQYLQINKLTAYRTSTDKGILDNMVYTVRNIGDADLNAIVELLFESGRIEGYSARVMKEYTIPTLKPGEKVVIDQSLGIYFADINKTKLLTMTIYEKYKAPRKDLELLKKEFVPRNMFETMEIFIHGKPDTV